MLVPLSRIFVDESATAARERLPLAEVIERDSKEEISVMVLTAVESVDNPSDPRRGAGTTRM